MTTTIAPAPNTSSFPPVLTIRTCRRTTYLHHVPCRTMPVSPELMTDGRPGAPEWTCVHDVPTDQGSVAARDAASGGPQLRSHGDLRARAPRGRRDRTRVEPSVGRGARSSPRSLDRSADRTVVGVHGRPRRDQRDDRDGHHEGRRRGARGAHHPDQRADRLDRSVGGPCDRCRPRRQRQGVPRLRRLGRRPARTSRSIKARGSCSTPRSKTCSPTDPTSSGTRSCRRQPGRLSWLALAPDDLSLN